MRPIILLRLSIWIFTFLISFIFAVLIGLLFVGAQHVFAGEFYVNGGFGQTRFQITAPDGTWREDGLGTRNKVQDFFFKAGAGYRFSEEWSTEVNWLHFGRMHNNIRTVNEDYDPIAHRCVRNCDKAMPGGVRQSTWGGEWTARRSFELGPFRPFLAAGVFGAEHRISFWAQHPTAGLLTNAFTGPIVGLVGGGGICYKWVCGETMYYRGIIEGGYPMSKIIIVPSLTIKIPL